MFSKHDPGDGLADTLENIERIEAYTVDLDRLGLEPDGRTRDAVERCLVRICEAVVRLGERGPELMPEQPLDDIRGMGDRLHHACDRMSNDILWQTIRDRLPSLKRDARQALTRLGSPANGG